jgi:serine/threonine-protein kinase
MLELRPGDVVGQYQIVRLVGSGGMAMVFEVTDVASGQRYAMKVLQRQLLQHPVIPQRFLREARAASALNTPYAVKVETTGDLADGSPYIVMEYLEGRPLRAIIDERAARFEAERVLSLADQAAQGIQDAHNRGIIHRDVKPENIFVIPTPQGERVKIVDFGISKIFSAEDGVKLTQTGVTVGTPQYMPVEQLRGVKDLDGRVDVYALGIVIFEMLAGVRPYDGFTYEEVILKVASTSAPSLSVYRADLPPGLVAVVDRSMAKDRNQRIGSMDELRAQLLPFWSGQSAETAQANLVQTGGYARATAGKTQVLQKPEAPASPPAPTLPDHVVRAELVAQVAGQTPTASMNPSQPTTPLSLNSNLITPTTNPSKALIWVLVIVAVVLLVLLISIIALAFLFLRPF